MPEAYVSQSVGLMRLWDSTLAPFLHYYLRCPNTGRRHVHEMVYGIGRPVLSLQNLRDVPVTIPPLAEQRRIVNKLDQLFSQIEKGEENLRRVEALVKRYRQSVLKAAVTGELTRDWRAVNRGQGETGEDLLQRILKARREAWEAAELAKMKAKGKAPKNDSWKQKYKEPEPPDTSELPELPEGWVWVTLESIASLVTDGDHNPPKRVEQGVPHLTARNVKAGRLTLDNCTFVNADGFAKTRARYDPRHGDVIITCVGTIGETAVVPEGLTFSADRNLAAVRVLDQVISSQYFQHALNAPRTQQAMRTASGSTAQPHLYLSDLRGIAIPCPPTIEQHAICSSLDAHFSSIDRFATEVSKHVGSAHTLRQSVLRAAFSGQLVPQDPDDEPATAFLERIAAERAAKAASKPKRGRRRKNPEAAE